MTTETETLEKPALTGDADGEVALTELEQLAVEMGWKPEKDYGGPDGKWKPAKEWVKGEREVNRGLKETVRGLRDTVDRLAKTASKQTERALKEQAEEINAKFLAAVENKDAQGAAAATLEMQQLQREATAETGGNVEDEFAKQNPWYGKEEDATDYAILISNREAKKGRSVQEQLESVDKAVRKRFPELFGAAEVPAAGKNPPVVATPSRGTPPAKEKGWSDLPPEVKRAGESYAKLFQDKHRVDPEKTKASFAKDYWADQA